MDDGGNRRGWSWVAAVLLSADVLGMSGMSLGSGDVLEVASSRGEVGVQIVGSDVVGQGKVFGVVVKGAGLKIEVQAVGSASQDDDAAF